MTSGTPRSPGSGFDAAGVDGQFRSKGWIGPIDAVGAAEVEDCRRQLDQVLARGDHVSPSNWHLDQPWVYRLASNPCMLAVARVLLGAEPSVWATEAWSRPPRSPEYTPWHQDAPFWPVPDMEVVSAWIALTPAGVGNGSVVLLSGTHLQTFPYVVNSDPNTRFDHVIPTEHLPMERASCPTLLPGQAIFFSQSIVHGAARNESDEPRVSVSIRYVPEIDDGTGGGAVPRPVTVAPVGPGPLVVIGWVAPGADQHGGAGSA